MHNLNYINLAFFEARHPMLIFFDFRTTIKNFIRFSFQFTPSPNYRHAYLQYIPLSMHFEN